MGPKAGYAKGRGRQLAASTDAVGRTATLDVEALYRSHGDMVLGRCRSLLRHEADAQDACQEVFLKVHRYRKTFRAEAKPSTYLFKVTTTVCLNRLRSRRRRREDLQDEDTPVPVTDTLLSGHALRDLTTRLLDLADEKTQKAIVYHYVDGMTHAETGKMLGLSAAAIRKRIATFKARFAANPPPWLDELENFLAE
jgi:RNA polymerase sigma factor (sigma-70 family)